MKITAIIPARYASIRFPGKPLSKILEKPMIQWVYDSVSKTKLINQVIIATDDLRILNTCKLFTKNVIMTDSEHKSGTDRIAQVAKNIDSDLILNIQGDEPLITDNVVNNLIELMLDKPHIKMGTLARKIKEEEINTTNVVKVSITEKGMAKNFSRRISPKEAHLINLSIFAHIGVYAYKRPFLLEFSKLTPTQGELDQSLEQLRAIENGYPIGIGLVQYDGIGVDTIEDLKNVEKILKEKNDKLTRS